MADEKKWYESKTLWTNIIAIIMIAIAGITGAQTDPGIDITILSIINIVLRLITKDEIVW